MLIVKNLSFLIFFIEARFAKKEAISSSRFCRNNFDRTSLRVVPTWRE